MFSSGDPGVARSMLMDAVVSIARLGDSHVFNSMYDFPKFLPRRFGGVAVAGAFVAGSGYTLGTPVNTGYGAGDAAQALTIPRSVRIDFNGTDAVAVTDAITNRVWDGADTNWTWDRAGAGRYWGEGYEWMYKQAGMIRRTMYYGTGANDVGGLQGRIRANGSVTSLGSGPSVPANTVASTLQTSEHTFDWSGQAYNADPYEIIAFAGAQAVNPNHQKGLIADMLALPPTIPHYRYYVSGVGGIRLAMWQDPTLVNQPLLSQFLGLNGFAATHLIVEVGTNEWYVHDDTGIANFSANLKAWLTLFRGDNPNLQMTIETPAVTVENHPVSGESTRIRLGQLDEQAYEFARDNAGAYHISHTRRFPSPAEELPWLTGDFIHPTPAGYQRWVSAAVEEIVAFAAANPAPTVTYGSSPTPVDHDGGDGVTVSGAASATDCLRYTDPDGAGVAGLTVSAYLASEFDASPPVRVPKAQTTTGADGRWASPLMLASGTYYVIADSAGDAFTTQKTTVVVP